MRILSCIAFFFWVSICMAGPGTGNKKTFRLYTAHYENVLGTSLELKVYAGSQEDASKAETAALAEISRMSKILSAYDPSSEFSAWQRTYNTAVKVSPELFEVLSLFDQWKSRTAGALDASAEVVTRLWKNCAAQNRIPTEEELKAAVAETQKTQWMLNQSDRTATHLNHSPLMLNSFAKSYIIKRAVDAAMANPQIQALVLNIGGDLLVKGNLKETVQISNPKEDAENDSPLDQLIIGDKAVATSGNYRRGELINGHWYSHIVDPRTGIPSDNIISATVVAPNATDAGALATAFNVMTPEESVQLASTIPGAEYLIITREGNRIQSKGWSAIESPAASAHSYFSAEAHKSASDFELVVNLEINTQKEGFVKRPYVAIWVEDENHAPVRTIALWHERDRYLPELKSWFLKYRGQYATDQSAFSTVSSATRSAGKYTVKWDGTDDKGNPVKPGRYIIKIEVAREHGTYQLMRQEIDLDQTAKQFKLPGNIEISAASLDYHKKS